MRRAALAVAVCIGVVLAALGARELRHTAEQPGAAAAEAAPSAFPGPAAVTALGRIEPKDGVIRVAGPSRPAVVIARLLIDDGYTVRQGDPIAILDSHAQQNAAVVRLKAELENATRERARHEKLHKGGIVSTSELDEWRTKTATLRAELESASADLEQSIVRAPISGQVLKVHARAGERVGADGIAELARTDVVNAVAEIYETDIGRVHVGQRAVITSPALSAGQIHGTVERIGLKIGKKDVLGTDPASHTDARVVEVEIRLDDPKQVAGLINLRVDVAITSE